MTNKDKKLADFSIYDFGNEYEIAGIVYRTKTNDKIMALLPEETHDFNINNQLWMEMTLEEWKKMIRQSDLLEVQILLKAADGKQTKTILRKSARQIDQRVAWKVYKRDDYTCQYCGITGIPLTVDHLVLWEEGGPTTEANLVTSCKKCNKTRGNTPYAEWIESDEYKNLSINAPSYAKQYIKELEPTLAFIEKVKNIKSR